MTSDLLSELSSRELLHDTTDRKHLAELLDDPPQSLYLGFDPTADSLHVGGLLGVVVLHRFRQAGHRPIALVGGATGMIGDPSGRSDERNLLSESELAANFDGIANQIRSLLGGEVEVLNNHDWTSQLSLLEFLRDVGKHATINQMVAKDSVRNRIEGETGISFTEFSYMLLQAHDFWWLNKHHDCVLQVGGSDQWGNITAGIDLIRKRNINKSVPAPDLVASGSTAPGLTDPSPVAYGSASPRSAAPASAVDSATIPGLPAHGLTWPLITRADGQKFGKTAEGAIWLSTDRTLPYDFHQYFLRSDDRDMLRLLLQLTLLPVSDIWELESEHQKNPERREAQQVLADEVTRFVHGEDTVRQANNAAKVLFGQAELTVELLESLEGIVGEVSVARAELAELTAGLAELLMRSGLCSSLSDARRQLKQSSIQINNQRMSDEKTGQDLADSAIGKYLLLQRGKKERRLVVLD